MLSPIKRKGAKDLKRSSTLAHFFLLLGLVNMADNFICLGHVTLIPHETFSTEKKTCAHARKYNQLSHPSLRDKLSQFCNILINYFTD